MQESKGSSQLRISFDVQALGRWDVSSALTPSHGLPDAPKSLIIKREGEG